MIRLAKLLEIPDILTITQACSKSMIDQGIYQWNEFYPSREAFEKDVARKELYVLEENDKIIGTIVVSTHMDKEYDSISWLTPNKNNIYIHRLAVDPQEQKKGYAKELMDFAEDYARKGGFISVRLDTFSKNGRNNKLYRARGYKAVGDIYFTKQSRFPFYCYELIL
ncbi:GNAT family N-acetyltransferase [Arenibacter sp. M-2]|uniref:GNAT family N-acetyltransferase n=1 Tax=unclassified Arenibacter TaxID=2615047 RepID=UPI000D757D19|nr:MULTISPECIES: GNAT family N-acetyltransferase [unclassified Arenibacter]MDL5510531.1 GNAT family N-acetyltransferase [Arenibacter sp. M-2]PXX31377.1 acetyltransferase (GNAT) family protein [Arenibacter sp. ARW7G5Y1]|tara:strand:+ start:1086 stop:1586 length:501 start_codon:yes stop_codon:yes gene_type:complete